MFSVSWLGDIGLGLVGSEPRGLVILTMGSVQNALGEPGAWQSVGDQTVIGAGEFNTTVIKLWQVKHTNQRLVNITQGYPTGGGVGCG